MTVAAIAFLLLAGTRVDVARVAAITVGMVVMTAAPSVAALLVLVLGLHRLLLRVRSRIKERESRREDAALLADLVALGLTGGLGVQQAMQIAAGAVGGEIADEVAGLLRQARVDGIAFVASHSEGAGRDLYREIGRAMRSGASLLDQVTRVADDLHATLVAARLERLRKVPVAMLFPLTLLILPGFLLLTVAPAVLDALSHLEM